MAEYIEREAVLALIQDNRDVVAEPTWELQFIRQDVMNIPAADVLPAVHGTWYGSGDGYADGHLVIDEWECPCCGKYFPEWDEKPDWNFCPNCGADMREREHGQD